jgi:hypothetical protein
VAEEVDVSLVAVAKTEEVEMEGHQQSLDHLSHAAV